jgi:hypothetical protein
MSKPDQDPLKRQIYERMVVKSTGELLKIWRKGDTREWTPVAFAVIKQILQERQVEIPPCKGEGPQVAAAPTPLPVSAARTKIGFSVFWGPLLVQLVFLSLVALIFSGSQFACVLPIGATLVVVASLILWIHFTLIRDYITKNNGQLLSIKWLVFTPAWFKGKYRSTATYAVEFIDHQGSYHKELCQTGLVNQVSFKGKL